MKTFNTYALLSLCLLMSCSKKQDVVRNETQEETATEVVAYDKAVYKKGATIYGSNNYTRIVVGDLASPIILSSPHDGTLEPSTIPDRTNPDAVTVRDTYATDLTFRIADALEDITGLRPHIIINMLRRSKMDPNRSLAEAYLTHADATKAWNDYQNAIKIARQIVVDNRGKGLYLDMHGHGHDKQRIEVAYTLSKTQLNYTDAQINGLASQSSIYAIAKTSPLAFSQLVRGDQAFGTLMANEGVPSVPSKQDPMPGFDLYFDGGYCTSTYGSEKGGTISAIQLETPWTNRSILAVRTTAGIGIANALVSYFKMHYAIDLKK